ncbi:MAG: nucleotidyltransferase domain-containing protein [Sphingomonadaceae bacterium]|nr:nucleotidyltransferase domain-containing protein [Sphingomonadaceae bacterium]
MSRSPHLSDHEKTTVLEILRRHLPDNTQVHVFGSRATGQCKPWSDLDLVIDAQKAIPLALLARISEAFDESSLPWKVDMVDRHSVSKEFARVIDATQVRIW